MLDPAKKGGIADFKQFNFSSDYAIEARKLNGDVTSFVSRKRTSRSPFRKVDVEYKLALSERTDNAAVYKFRQAQADALGSPEGRAILGEKLLNGRLVRRDPQTDVNLVRRDPNAQVNPNQRVLTTSRKDQKAQRLDELTGRAQDKIVMSYIDFSAADFNAGGGG